MIKSSIKLFLNLDKPRLAFIGLAMALSFCICCEYAIARPVINSVFISAFGASNLPLVWLIAVPFNLGIVFCYNHLTARLGAQKTLIVTLLAITLGHACFALLLPLQPQLSFPLYLWKDAYIMVMFQHVWSLIHSCNKLENAKKFYGFIFGIGGLGGMIGSTIPGFFAVKASSEKLLFLAAPLYLIFYFLFKKFHKLALSLTNEEIIEPKKSLDKDAYRKGFSLVQKNPILLGIMLLVVFMHFSSTLVDFQFQTFLAQKFPIQDIRTEYSGKVYALGNILTMTCQLAGVAIAARLFSLRSIHMSIPLLLTLGALSFAIAPSFTLISLFLVGIKCMDFSFFTIFKEMLYLPLRVEEKYYAKSIIDIFICRSAKAFASLFLLLLQFYHLNVLSMVTAVLLAVFALWIFVAHRLFRKFPILDIVGIKTKAP